MKAGYPVRLRHHERLEEELLSSDFAPHGAGVEDMFLGLLLKKESQDEGIFRFVIYPPICPEAEVLESTLVFANQVSPLL